ncbi:hypothetical protein MANES_07G132400v8, partial [Manihot esculenta]
MKPPNTATAIFLVHFFTSFFLSLPCSTTASSPALTALYAFGDSTDDPGNNNQLVTLFRSDHPPYGKDFPYQVPTGRFSDGKLSTDFIVSSLGLKDLLPAYLDPKLTTNDLLTGVSFASAGTGLDDLTAELAGALKISSQLDYFDEAVTRMKGLVGEEKAKFIVENAIFIISVGSNDFMDNFYELPTRKFQFSISGYQDFLLHELESAIQRLYNAGGRRFAIVGLPPIGCLPIQVTIGSLIPGKHMFQRVCVEQQNTDSIAYNIKLQSLISRLKGSWAKGAKISYLDIYYPLEDMINNPSKYGFEETLRGCCGLGIVETGPLCDVMEATCNDASKYIFWDAVHPTQATYFFLAQTALQT